MPVSLISRWLAPALLLGVACVITGCSAEPDAEHLSDSQKALEEPAQAAPVVTGPSPDVAAPGATARLAVDAEGLRWFLQPSGSARPIPFGRSESEVVSALERLNGSAVKGTNQDCGAGPVQVASWADGMSLLFQDGRFVGWGLGRRADGQIGTAAGIGPGSTRAELDAAYSTTVSQTSLGSEFSAGGLHGILDGTSSGARITDMWAGVNCVAR